MTITPPTREPDVLVVGTSWEWDKHFSTCPPSDGWALTYEFTGAGVIPTITAGASSEGDYWEVREDAADTAGFTPGTYEVGAYIAKGTAVHEIWRGMIFVRDDTATDTAQQSHDEKVLAAINATIEGRVTADTREVQINGRKIIHMEPGELLELQRSYRSRVTMARKGIMLSIPVTSRSA